MDYQKIVNTLIEKNQNNNEDEIVVLNNDKAILNKEDYNLVEGQALYFEPDNFGRSNGGIALISKNTFPLVINKKLTYPNPYGWTKKIEEQHIFERCHIIAYNLSAKLTDKRNIFIGTEHLNTSLMFSVENEVKNYIDDNNVRVIYKVTVKYKNNNQIPTGILIEAVSLDDEFSICRFCYNTEKNVIFEYTDGTIIKNTLPKKISQILKKDKNKTNNNNK